MENHPIPQNVTGFQFKLIGEMTVKQFAYLAGGVIATYLFFTFLPLPFILKLPFVILPAGMGAAFAFLPIEGRPLDTMLINFAKAILTPNEYVYQKAGGQLDIHLSAIQKTHTVKNVTSPQSADDLQTYLSRLQKKSHDPLDEKENMFFKNISRFADPRKLPVEKPVSPSLLIVHSPVKHISPDEKKRAEEQKNKVIQKLLSNNTPDQAQPAQNLQPQVIQSQINTPPAQVVETNNENKIENLLDKQALLIKQELEQAKMQEAAQKGMIKAEEAHKKVIELERLLKEALMQRQLLEKKLFALTKQMEIQGRNVFLPSEGHKLMTPNVRKIPKDIGIKTGVPISPDVPNLVTGIIKDSRGNVLPNILVEIKDKGGNPIRAFKTNNLGQFASATPLSNGVFTLIFEDPLEKHKFDNVEIVANGEIITPLEVISTDEREELRKELFGGTVKSNIINKTVN